MFKPAHDSIKSQKRTQTLLNRLLAEYDRQVAEILDREMFAESVE